MISGRVKFSGAENDGAYQEQEHKGLDTKYDLLSFSILIGSFREIPMRHNQEGQMEPWVTKAHPHNLEVLALRSRITGQVPPFFRPY